MFILLFYSCANIQPPSGGPPDTTPPEILETFPKNRTTNFNETKIQLKFNKYMNKNSVIENLHIQPLIKTEFDWSGKILNIHFKEKLKENTTYSVNLGTDYTDFKNNKPLQSYTLTFSTGKNIDTGNIKGMILNGNSQSLYIFAYNISNLNPDTLNLYNVLPDYRVQVGKMGYFDLQGLADGKYRLVAVNDQFKDLRINENQDFFSTAFQDFNVENGKSQDALFRFGKIADNTPPKIFSVEAFSNRKIKVYFSEHIEIKQIQPSAFVVFDSLANLYYPIIQYYLEYQNNNVLNLITEKPIPPRRKLLFSINNTNSIISDTINNLFVDFEKKFLFTSSVDLDSSLFQLISISLRDSALNVSIDKPIVLTFTEPIEKLNIDYINFYSLSDSVNVKYNISIKNNTQILITPILEYNKQYLLEIKPNAIVPLFGINNFKNSIKIHFKTEMTPNYGSVSGELIDSSGNNYHKIIVLENNQFNYIYQAQVDSSGKWLIQNIRPGEYNVWIYEDRNNNLTYDFGNIYPFEYSEKVYLTGVVANVRSRWETEGLILRIGK